MVFIFHSAAKCGVEIGMQDQSSGYVAKYEQNGEEGEYQGIERWHAYIEAF